MFKKSNIMCLITTFMLGIIPFVTTGTNVYANETVNSIGNQETNWIHFHPYN